MKPLFSFLLMMLFIISAKSQSLTGAELTKFMKAQPSDIEYIISQKGWEMRPYLREDTLNYQTIVWSHDGEDGNYDPTGEKASAWLDVRLLKPNKVIGIQYQFSEFKQYKILYEYLKQVKNIKKTSFVDRDYTVTYFTNNTLKYTLKKRVGLYSESHPIPNYLLKIEKK